MLKNYVGYLRLICFCTLATSSAFASEADIHIPDLTTVKFAGLGGVTGRLLLVVLGIRRGIHHCGALFGIVQYLQTKDLPVHDWRQPRFRAPSARACKTISANCRASC